MARTIEEYQRDYQKARTAGNAAGMQAANDGANAIRKQQGQAQQVANADIAKFRGVTSTGQQTQPTATALRGSADGVTVASDRDQQIRDQMNANSNKWQGASQEERERLHNENIELSKQLGSGVSFNPGSGTWAGSSTSSQIDTAKDDQQKVLDAWREENERQNREKVDHAVNQSVAELERAAAEAQPMFREQQEQTARDEAQGLDNSALYAELRGDKGGIGKEQYSSVQNTAAQNRQAVSSAQTKLASDTQRQIADLRAKGEFEKADAVLAIAQNYLTQLTDLERWAAERQLSAQQLQEEIRQWNQQQQTEANRYNTAQTGFLPDGTKTLAAQQDEREQMKSQGFSLLESGFIPSDSQLSAMGWTKEQAQSAITVMQLEAEKKVQEQAKKKETSSGNGGNSGNGVATYDPEGLFKAAKDSGNPYTFMKQAANYKKYGLTTAPVTDEYDLWARGKEITPIPAEVQDYLRQLEVRPNSNVVIASLIKSYFDNGTIDETQAEELLLKYKLV